MADQNSEERKDVVRLTHEPLNISECVDVVRSDHAGAISSFIGTTRDFFGGKRVLKLSYEAYEQMADAELRRVLQQVRDRWDVYHAAIYHRLGEVPVGAASVIITVSSCHRRESLEAVSFAIDTLKETVPIWKKEVYADGAASWKENSECSWSASREVAKATDGNGPLQDNPGVSPASGSSQ